MRFKAKKLPKTCDRRLAFHEDTGQLDPRMVELARLLARQAAQDYASEAGLAVDSSGD
jgi:hypothetical protein